MIQATSGLLAGAAFRIESRQVVGGRALDPDEGGLPSEASKHGVTLRVLNEYIAAREPA